MAWLSLISSTRPLRADWLCGAILLAAATALAPGVASAEEAAVPPPAVADAAGAANVEELVLLPEGVEADAAIVVEAPDASSGEPESLTGTSANDDLNVEREMSPMSGGHCPHSRRALAPTS